MSRNKIICCSACNEPIAWHETIVEVDNKYYHSECLTLHPTDFVVFLDGNFLGAIENDGESAFLLLCEGEYIDDDWRKN